MQGYQIYSTAGINGCHLISLHAIASTESAQTLVSRSGPAVPVSPGHAMHSQPYPPSRNRRR
ncbi:hypothetical protein [Dictyobacter formicarum]|uniref:Uncharacterized protein n=1 Tax=Dictyobacter formicarum TaxID=2778368 RepID=A0ABQ3VH91_9CHLR|nr:hypothetical protein [Dictyobacter formicarum]GHO85547.1 hypothetical protein KSZ_35530 [Dictyobacter formicarum]